MIFNQYRSAFDNLSADAAAIREQINESITMNFIRWNVWGEPNPKDSLKDYAGSYEDGYQRLTDWLENQVSTFSVQQVHIPFAVVDEDFAEMSIVFDNGNDDTPVVFAVWSDENGQDDLNWYYAEKNSDGLWEAKVDLSAHGTAGKYTIHTSTIKDGVRQRVAIGYAYIEKINEPEFSAKLSENQLNIEATMRNVGMYEELAVRVWCKADGDGDLREYAVTEQAGATKTCLIELRNHDELGEYCVQFYGKTGFIRPTFEEYPHRYNEPDTVSLVPGNPDFSYTADDIMTFFEGKGVSQIVIVNPDNPSGNYIPKQDLLRLVDWTGEKGIKLVIDESFVDFADEADSTLIDRELLDNNPHLYVMKSISKSYGVPGLRLGVLASGDIATIARMKKDVSIWNINSFAEFYMQIEEKYNSCYAEALVKIRAERERFAEELGKIEGIRVIPSQANFIMVELRNASPRELLKALLFKHQLLVKDLSSKTGGKYLRIAVRNTEDNDMLLEALKEELK